MRTRRFRSKPVDEGISSSSCDSDRFDGSGFARGADHERRHVRGEMTRPAWISLNTRCGGDRPASAGGGQPGRPHHVQSRSLSRSTLHQKSNARSGVVLAEQGLISGVIRSRHEEPARVVRADSGLRATCTVETGAAAHTRCAHAQRRHRMTMARGPGARDSPPRTATLDTRAEIPHPIPGPQKPSNAR